MKTEHELKGTKDEINAVICAFVNSGYKVYFDTKKVGNSKRKVLVLDDRKGEEK